MKTITLESCIERDHTPQKKTLYHRICNQ